MGLSKYLIWFILLGSLLLNLVAVWGFFHYIRFGGSPLGELKRMLTGTTHQKAKTIPYEKENAEIVKNLENGKQPPNSVVFFGASITARWNLTRDFPNITPINRGVGNQLAPRMLERFKRDVLDLKPKAVVIKFCSINIRPHVPQSALRDAMTMMVELSRAKSIEPIVCTIIPAGKPEAHIGDFSVRDSLNNFNEWAREYAKENNLLLIDFAKGIGDENGDLPRALATDPVHVNEKGYEVLSRIAQPIIDSALNRKNVSQSEQK